MKHGDIEVQSSLKVNSESVKPATIEQNMMLNAFRIAVNGSLTQFNMVDGIVDEYEDESGIISNINKLILNFEDADTATSTTDESNSNHSITFNGNAQIDTADFKFGTASLLLDGTGDYLSIADSSDWDLIASNTDNWTIDFWVKHTDHAGVECYISQVEDGNNQWSLYHSDGNGIGFFAYTGGVKIIDIPFGGEITDTNWHHIALIKIGDEYGIYKDGTQVGYVQDSDIDTYSAPLHIGFQNDGSGWTFDGWMDSFRIINSNPFNASPNSTPDDTITIPTSAHTLSGESINQSYDSTNDLYSPTADTVPVVLVYGEGTDEDTTISNDGSGGAVTMNNGAKLDNGATKFNATTSMFFDGTDDYLTITDDSGTDFDLMASAVDSWTVDFWVKHTSVGSEYYVAQNQDASNRWIVFHDGTGIGFYCAVGGSTIAAHNPGTTGIGDTNWHHVAFVKVAQKYAVYLDGTQIAYDLASSNGTVTADLQIGREPNAPGQYLNGYMEQLQVINENKFNADPNAGLTDTITIPTGILTVQTHNMTIISNAFTAETQPDTARIVLFEEDVDSVTLNTDLIAYISRDGGSNFTAATLTDEGNYESGKSILSASVDISGQSAGTSMVYKIATANNKDLKIHGCGLTWD